MYACLGGGLTSARHSVRFVIACAMETTAEDAELSSLYVSATPMANDKIDLMKIIGEYSEDGVDHGRPSFKKKTRANGGIDVFVYYWDERDGEAWNGWWFANKVGGDQILVRNGSAEAKPPADGWTIPWYDSEVETDLTIVRGPPGYGDAAPFAEAEEASSEELGMQAPAAKAPRRAKGKAGKLGKCGMLGKGGKAAPQQAQPAPAGKARNAGKPGKSGAAGPAGNKKKKKKEAEDGFKKKVAELQAKLAAAEERSAVGDVAPAAGKKPHQPSSPPPTHLLPPLPPPSISPPMPPSIPPPAHLFQPPLAPPSSPPPPLGWG